MKRILAILALATLTSAAWAQANRDEYANAFPSPYQQYVTFNFAARYGVAFPLGGQKGYIDRISPANLAIEGEWLFPQRFSLGLKTGYQYNQQRLGRSTYTYTNGNTVQDISAVQTRTLSVIPAMASLSYYFADNAAAIRPYVQFAGGGAFVDYTNFFGTLSDQQTGFKGAIAPAIGLKYYGGREKGFGAEIQAQYQNIFFNYDLLKNSSPSLMLSAGIVYRWY
ncbi:hypothetical protein HNV11_03845 [Spirosoma taeanense]|uniref:Outer membrane protein beta-barrel domain-containing protein n=1 Tax=Spirosoma taeanense TaxID=2735870 RepID=A0A6M5Y440_9BACT|nr:OmpW family outer membrane protein [Spirosoma taeanense]QJW88569.1 hypothetical protein HNV11_03845 [Spirosoma taeanense]